MLDTLFIGAGPAGIQASCFLKKHGVAHEIFEKDQMLGELFGYYPVLRLCRPDELIEEFHVIEDLEAQWTIEEHFDHISGFISNILREVSYES